MTSDRRRSVLVMAAFGAPAAAFLASGGSVYPLAEAPAPKPVAEEGPPCCMELVAAAQTALPWEPSAAPAAAGPQAAEVVTAASRWRVVDMNVELALPAGVAPESGLQVKTIPVSYTHLTLPTTPYV